MSCGTPLRFVRDGWIVYPACAAQAPRRWALELNTFGVKSLARAIGPNAEVIPGWKKFRNRFSASSAAPCGRSVDSRPSFRTVRSLQVGPPNGQPRSTDRWIASNSASVNGSLTCRAQPGRRASGQADNSRWSSADPRSQRYRLPHCQSWPAAPSFARAAFRSTYRRP